MTKEKDSGKTVQLTFQAREEDAEQWRDRVDNMSGSFRAILEAWNEVEEDHNINNDTQRINEIVLQTYINSIDKHITLLENQKKQLKEKREKIREEEEEEILVKIDLGLNEGGF